MLRCCKKTKIQHASNDVLTIVYNYLKVQDYFNGVSLSKEFYLVFIDKNKYSIIAISRLTGNSDRTITRHIHHFNRLIKKILENKEKTTI